MQVPMVKEGSLGESDDQIGRYSSARRNDSIGGGRKDSMSSGLTTSTKALLQTKYLDSGRNSIKTTAQKTRRLKSSFKDDSTSMKY